MGTLFIRPCVTSNLNTLTISIILSYTYLATNLQRTRSNTRSLFLPRTPGFSSEYFLLLDQLDRKNQIHRKLLSLTEKRRMYTFLKGIRTKWNVDNLVQDLNLVRRFHFQRWYCVVDLGSTSSSNKAIPPCHKVPVSNYLEYFFLLYLTPTDISIRYCCHF